MRAALGLLTRILRSASWCLCATCSSSSLSLTPKPLKGLAKCTLFAVKKQARVYTLAAVVSNKLMLYEYSSEGAEFRYTKTISLSDVPRALCWAGKALCVGLPKTYLLVDIGGATRELSPVGRNRAPQCLYLAQTKEVLLVKDKEGVLVEVEDSERAARRPAPLFLEPPTALAE
eukprot:RCo038334